MHVYAGIDEAGYGPVIGPLVVARAVLCFEAPPRTGDLPSLWVRMRGAISRHAGDRRGRIAVEDSKRLYGGGIGLRHLERGVLSFLGHGGIHPSSVDDLLQAIGLDEESCGSDFPWYGRDVHAVALPHALRGAPDRDLLAKSHALLGTVGTRIGLSHCELGAGVAFEDRYNRMLRASGSKAVSNWSFFGRHLRLVWDRWGPHDPFAVVDRQSGRKAYGPLLEVLFPEAKVTIVHEEHRHSTYRVEGSDRAMTVRVEVQSETHHAAAALASMTAKYVRELWMVRLHAWSLLHAPDVRPSAGYYADGRRYARELLPVLARLGHEPEMLIRAW